MDRLSPEWWRERLLADLTARSSKIRVFTDYYAGEYPPPVIPDRYSKAYRNLMDLSRTPWARLIIDTISERIALAGVRTGLGDDADAQVWNGLKANYIDADQRSVHAETLVSGIGYVSVWPSPDGPRVRPESPMEVIHASAPGDPRSVIAALKVYPDDVAGVWRAELYLPNSVYRYVSDAPQDALARAGNTVLSNSLVPDPDMPEVPNPTGIVPVVPFLNRARAGTDSYSELHDLIPVLRRIDKVTLDMLAAADAAGFRQRWATGLEIPRDPDTGQPIEPFNAAVAKLWVSESPDTHFGSFEATALEPYIRVIGEAVAAAAAISRVPAHYLMSDLANPPSAESLVASEAGLVAKVRERQMTFGQSWEQVVRLYAAASGEMYGAMRPEMVWRTAEFRSPALVADALTKLATIGIPNEALWEMYGATPDQIASWRTMQASDAFTAAINTLTAG